MGSWAVVNGTRLRVTKINSCGRPEAGPKGYLVTEGFSQIRFSPEMRAAQDQEQLNAGGKVCVKHRVPAELKWYNISLTMCDVDPELYTMMTGFPLILDHNDEPIGYDDKSTVDDGYGVALETWTSGRGEDDCPVPTDDSIFSGSSTGLSFGYFLIGGTEWQQEGDVTIENGVSTFGLTGRSVLMPAWGRGPWNVIAIDDDGTPGRMLTPMAANGKDGHRRLFRTTIAPPEVTNGACALDITGKFTDPNFYIGGPAGEPAADVAPLQPICGGIDWVITITGAPSGGTWSLTINGQTATGLDEIISLSALKTAIEGLSNVAVGQVEVTGTPGTTYNVRLAPALAPVSISVAESFTGGTDPEIEAEPAA